MLQPQTILNRICECINDLGLVLDQLYKFPQKQRETYFDRIQSMKNKLLLLKTNFRESSLATTEKQYKQIYLAMNTLKSDIQQQTALIPVYKENRESNRFKEIKDVKKNYEEAMKLLVSKDDEIAELKNLLFQKQQLVHLNLQQLKNLKHERQILVQVGRLGKYEQNSVEIEYEAIKAALLRAQSQVMEFRKREEEKDKAFSSAIVELEELKGDLIATKEKLNYYEQMAQYNLAKTIRAQENIKKAQKEAYGLDENYKLKQYSNFKKLREAGELELELKGKAQLLRQLELQNKRLNQDLQVMENQLARLEKNNEEINCSAKQDKQRWQQQRSKFQQDLRHAQLRQNQLKKLVQQADKKYLLLFGKLSQSQEWRVKLKQFECRNELMQQKSARLENCIQECRCELEAKQREKQQISIRLDKELNNLREYQVQNFRLKEKLKCREQEKNKIANELEAYHNRLKDYERMKIVAEMREKENEAELREERTRVVKLEERQKVRDKQISSLKMKLLRAKIQTIHQIREVIT